MTLACKPIDRDPTQNELKNRSNTDDTFAAHPLRVNRRGSPLSAREGYRSIPAHAFLEGNNNAGT